MSRVLRWILAIAVVAAIAASIVWFRRREAASAAADREVLRTAEVTRDTLDVTVVASGNVTASREVELSFESPGTVDQVAVEVGDRVAKGEELARLDDDVLRDALRQAELALEETQVNLRAAVKPAKERELELARVAIQESAQAMVVAERSEALARARASQQKTVAEQAAEDARDAYEDYIELLQEFDLPESYAASITAAYMEAQGNVGVTQIQSEHAIRQAQSQYTSAYQRYRQAQRNLEQLQEGPETAQVRQLELQVEQARLNLEAAQADLSSATITAPFDGLVSSVNVQAGALAPTGLPAIALLDDESYYVELTVDEIDIGAVEEGQAVEVNLDAYPAVTLVGEVDAISALPEDSDNVVIYPVKVLLTDPNEVEIRDGMTASARVLVDQRPDVLLAPNWAVRTGQEGDGVYTYCYCLEAGAPERVTIEIGARGDGFTEIVSGLEEGATVVLVAETRDLLDFAGPPSDGQ